MHRKLVTLIGIVAVTLFAGALAVLAQGPEPGAPQTALGSGFTYQGQLKQNNAPANGPFTLGFRLYDSLSGGSEVGSPITQTILITAGLFTTRLDFGPAVFDGSARWLGITLEGGGAELAPRQPVSAVPYALHAADAWDLNGNGGTSSGNFLGTTDAMTLTLGVSGTAALRVVPAYDVSGRYSPDLIGGSGANRIGGAVGGATIAGGGASAAPNVVSADFGTVGGGFGNQIPVSGTVATVGGGSFNTASGISATVSGGGGNTASGKGAYVGGGEGNVASGDWATINGGAFSAASNVATTVGGGFNNYPTAAGATIAGGESNFANGSLSAVGGGMNNYAVGQYATVPGGHFNTAQGQYSFAAGYQAKALQDGTFVWADDSVTVPISSTAANQFLVRAAGGVGINTNAPVANTLTVNGQVVAGGTTTPFGQEPLVSQGANSGVSLNDRDNGANPPRWVIFPQGSVLHIWDGSDRVLIGSSGVLTAAGFSGQCLSSGTFATSSANACNMDVAEAFASTDRTEPGDVVALAAAAGTPTVRKANGANAGGEPIVGVVSTNPGLVFDNGQTHLAGDNSQLITAGRTVVALAGRVPVKVSLENGPVAVGDPLTSASLPGYAMKATQAGQIIGYALQASDQLADGKLLAWLQPGLYVPPQQLARLDAAPGGPDGSAKLQAEVDEAQARDAALAQQNAALAARVTALEQAARSNGAPVPAAGSDLPTNWLLLGGLVVLGPASLRNVCRLSARLWALWHTG